MTKGWMYTLYEDNYAPIAEATHYTFRKLVFATIFFFFFLQWRVGGPSENMLPLKGQQCKLISWRKKELQHKPNPIP